MSTNLTEEERPPAGDRQPSKGEASRATILLTAAKLATTKGLHTLSIGDLAAAVGMSKSGLYAHFKSKEELEVATIETATAIFDGEVLRPATAARAGTERLWALVDAFLSHVERKVFPGGCFFAAVAAELDTRPGPARDRVFRVLEQWDSLFRQCIADAQASGEIDPGVEVGQAVFEIQAMLLAGNFQFVMSNDTARLAQARQGVEHVLTRLAAGDGRGKKRPARAPARARSTKGP
jgi:AcrR family transcriptional regulator